MIFQRKRLRDHFETLADYDGQLIRVARSKVYSVKNGVATYVDKLPFYDPNVGRSRGWDEVIEVATMPGNTGDQLVNLVNKIPTNVQEKLIEKGKDALGINERDPGLGPMNAEKKRAIQVANGMPRNGISESPLLSNDNLMLYIAIIGLIVGVMVYLKK